MSNLFERGEFTSNAGLMLDYKIDCDALTDEDIETLAKVISDKIDFSTAVSVPRGGDKLTAALKRYEDIIHNTVLIVDDVLTTGGSMERKKKEVMSEHDSEIVGVVIFAREKCPDWITAVFQLW